jgi:hypothetical protein
MAQSGQSAKLRGQLSAKWSSTPQLLMLDEPMARLVSIEATGMSNAS